jgi:hypothetical protein
MKFTGAALINSRGRGGRSREGVHTESIHADVVTGEMVVLGKFAGMKGAKLEEVLHTLPHWMQQIPNQFSPTRRSQSFKRGDTNRMAKHPGWQKNAARRSEWKAWSPWIADRYLNSGLRGISVSLG